MDDIFGNEALEQELQEQIQQTEKKIKKKKKKGRDVKKLERKIKKLKKSLKKFKKASKVELYQNPMLYQQPQQYQQPIHYQHAATNMWGDVGRLALDVMINVAGEALRDRLTPRRYSPKRYKQPRLKDNNVIESTGRWIDSQGRYLS